MKVSWVKVRVQERRSVKVVWGERVENRVVLKLKQKKRKPREKKGFEQVKQEREMNEKNEIDDWMIEVDELMRVEWMDMYLNKPNDDEQMKYFEMKRDLKVMS